MTLQIDGLTKRFGGQAVVDGLSIDIAEAEFFAIVGASGCGKSTLLRLIAGLETADAGSIRLHGEPVSGPGLHVPPEGRGFGVVFQSYALWPHLDVRGNVAFPIETAGASRNDAARAADRHLATVALQPFATRRPAELSGGQRQRVALARCLAQGARTILMDEPLANLDPHLRGAMERELLAFHAASGATTLYITHDQREAMAVADRMAVMSAGRFLQVGTPQEIYERPASEEIARFIGQGVVLPVEIAQGTALIAGQRVFLRVLNGAETGPRSAMLRPSDITATDPGAEGAVAGRTLSVLYRGGLWEALVAVEGLAEPLPVHLNRPARAGEAIGLRLTGGWLLPEAAMAAKAPRRAAASAP
ncbi:ABC transporter ATP-binding protein [Rhodobacteraceae bacterium N5(2021)]|uniref:ABC transporter ATP-binding protein n=1 Tax=Gymnodinialimonas phycosphaerae TaxID=2841589 RepID=A0A975TRW2_9RHOB|nr:ABC transporter ATP-binding protein [Gymnodinialimonas phycosphaerae]MBY4893516.1 ABC transporter ATP-binding protein [Gymnodinialimonas phycosphaerae]